MVGALHCGCRGPGPDCSWIAIYPVDRVIQLTNNRGLTCLSPGWEHSVVFLKTLLTVPFPCRNKPCKWAPEYYQGNLTNAGATFD